MSTTLRREREKELKNLNACATSRVSGPTRNVFMKSSIYILQLRVGKWERQRSCLIFTKCVEATHRKRSFLCVCVFACVYVNEKWRAAFYCVVLLFFFSLVLHQIQSVLKKVSVQQENK